jgi:hypothetical protein
MADARGGNRGILDAHRSAVWSGLPARTSYHSAKDGVLRLATSAVLASAPRGARRALLLRDARDRRLARAPLRDGATGTGEDNRPAASDTGRLRRHSAHWRRPMSSRARVRRTMLYAPRFELQLAPTLTVLPEVRETVSRAFDDAGVAFDWLPMPGDFTAEDAARRGGIERIAQPSLHIVLSSETDADPSHLVESVHNELASALVRVRSGAADLPISVRSHTSSGRCWFAFGPSASPQDIADGLTHVREAETSSGVAGWDEQARRWVRL